MQTLAVQAEDRRNAGSALSRSSCGSQRRQEVAGWERPAGLLRLALRPNMNTVGAGRIGLSSPPRHLAVRNPSALCGAALRNSYCKVETRQLNSSGYAPAISMSDRAGRLPQFLSKEGIECDWRLPGCLKINFHHPPGALPQGISTGYRKSLAGCVST
jgi:hypothetical protein